MGLFDLFGHSGSTAGRDHCHEMKRLLSLIENEDAPMKGDGVYMTGDGTCIHTYGTPGSVDFAFGFEGSGLAFASSKAAVENAFSEVCPDSVPDNASSFRVILPSSKNGRGMLYKKNAFTGEWTGKRDLSYKEDDLACGLVAEVERNLSGLGGRERKTESKIRLKGREDYRGR